VAAILSGLVMGISIPNIFKIYGRTIVKVRFSLLTIAAMLGLGMLTRYSGVDATMGLAFARTGCSIRSSEPCSGWLGVALTGSDTSSNVLFGSLQKITAQQIGIAPSLMAGPTAAAVSWAR
jgi:lactate permease